MKALKGHNLELEKGIKTEIEQCHFQVFVQSFIKTGSEMFCVIEPQKELNFYNIKDNDDKTHI